MAMQRERSLGRGVAAIASGMAVGIMSGRLLPPLLAAASGSVSTTLGQDPFERLIQDHRRILSLLDRMHAASDASTLRRGALFLALKRTLGKHALAEEDVVYPLLHERADAAASRQLYVEHADMKIHLFALERLLKSRESWAQPVDELRQLVRRHIADEEGLQFPKLKALIDEPRRRRLNGQIRREEALLV